LMAVQHENGKFLEISVGAASNVYGKLKMALTFFW